MPSEAEGGVVYQVLAGYTTRFPRPEFMRRQQEWGERFREKVASPPEPAARTTEPTPAAEEAQPLPETMEELQAALREARVEAARWRKAFEQRKSILHDNQ